MNKTLAIIGGTGLTQLPDLTITKAWDMETPFGPPSAPILEGTLKHHRVLFLARHGHPHSIAPHQVNYRANLWALNQLKTTDIIAITAVGGISQNMPTGSLVVPNQLIDYTSSRANTFFDDPDTKVVHIDFSEPYSQSNRSLLLQASKDAGIDVIDGGVYGVTQGPRLETAAEISRMERDGCHLVGMTAMPEAALAREMQIHYAGLSLVVNKAAGKEKGRITLKAIENSLSAGMELIKPILLAVVNRYYA